VAAHRNLFDRVGDPSRPLRVFLSYSRDDTRWREEVDKHLAALKKERLLEVWYDRLLLPGTRWDPKIMKELEEADIVLLLISASFMHSEFCYSREMKAALACQARGQLAVVPIAVHDCDWGEAPFAELTSLPPRSKPLSSWSNRHAGLKVMSTGLRRLVEVIRAARRGEIEVPNELSIAGITAAAAGLGEEEEASAFRIAGIAADAGKGGGRVGADQTPSRERQIPQPQRAVFLPLLCNRDGPAGALEAALGQWQRTVQRRPVLCVLQGDEREAHDAFVERISADILPRSAAAVAAHAINSLPAVRWPDDVPSHATPFQIFGPRLASSLQLPPFTREDQIRAALTREKGVTIVRASLFAQDWGSGAEDLLGAWLSLWHEWPKIAAGRMLLVLLLIKYQSATAAHPRIAEITERNLRLKRACGSIDESGYPGLVICRAPPLTPVKRKHVSEWLECGPVRQWCASTGGAWRVDRHVRDLFAVQDEAPMELVLDRLDTVLREFRKAG
jgi:hypothetical protein